MNTLIHLFCQINDSKQMEDVLMAVLTDKEREAIGNRLQIIAMLSKKMTQRDISSRLGVGIATVTRGAHAFKEGKFEAVEALLGNMPQRNEIKSESL